MHVQRTSRALLVVMLFVGPAWAAPAAAETFTANWTFYTGGKVPAPSPFYDCDFMGSGGLICQWIWSQGLRLSDNPPNFPMYGDGAPYFDAYGFALPLESEASAFDAALLQIVPQCLGGICFGTFTPLSMVADGRIDFSDHSPDGVSEPGGVFFASSKGGLITTLDGLANFAGPEWTDITWMGIGLFWPDGCGDPEGGVFCQGGAQDLSILSLTFDAAPIPEPASVVLLGTGLLALARRHRRRS